MRTVYYESIIRRLMQGYVPNHKHGELVRKWWHPTKGDFKDMSEEEYYIVKDMEHRIQKEDLASW